MVERIRLISQENAQLRAELGSIKDRLANVERIVTDSSHSLDREIEAAARPRTTEEVDDDQPAPDPHPRHLPAARRDHRRPTCSSSPGSS
jgi:hypothetical protein